jgi:hypothetical protein
MENAFRTFKATISIFVFSCQSLVYLLVSATQENRKERNLLDLNQLFLSRNFTFHFQLYLTICSLQYIFDCKFKMVIQDGVIPYTMLRICNSVADPDSFWLDPYPRLKIDI